MLFNDLLALAGISTEQTVILRHTPKERGTFARVLPWLAAEQPDLFTAYQSVQGPAVERMLAKRPIMACFLDHGPGRGLFVGIYEITGATPVPMEQFWTIPGYEELRALGMHGRDDDDPRTTILHFHQRRTERLAEYVGRLIIGWPSGRNWVLRARNNPDRFPVLAILEEPALERGMPHWTELVLSWSELAVLPRGWQTVLAQWRGIYLIRDTVDGKGYVGSAGGAENLLGRWRNYSATGHGGNRLLLERDPSTFRFSILQRVSPDMPREELVALEASWKARLGTRAPEGLNDN